MNTLSIRPGQTVANYDVLRPIGSGGAGTVYEAVHRSLGRRVALKLLHARASDAARADQARARFMRETRAACRVRHAHVVEIFDFGETDGVTFLAMELVEGGTLAQLLEREGKLPLSRAVEILLPILSAVAELHLAGILHRDIKPSNILLAGARDLCPKLADFGASRLDDDLPSITQSQGVLGTPAYMPPELVLFTPRAATERSDQYSLAITLYECATGERPFNGATTYEIMHSVVSGAAPPPSSRNQSLPKAFDEVVLRALHRDPSARFASVGELARALLPFAATNVAARWRAEFVPRIADAALESRVEAPERAPAAAVTRDSSAKASASPRILHCADGVAVAEVANVCVVIWRGAVIRSRFELQRSGLAEVVKRHPDGAAFLCVVEPTAIAPNDELRKASSDMVACHGAQLKCVGCVIEAAGFLAAIHRGATTAMLFFLRRRSAVPVSFFANARDAVRWMRRYIPIASTDELMSAVEHIRARLPAPQG
jgi:tRNA A-37 threonylcarbamoyl transferase component Bud32